MINPYSKCGPCPFKCGLKIPDGSNRCAMNRCMRDYNIEGQIEIEDKNAKIYLGDHPVRPSTTQYP